MYEYLKVIKPSDTKTVWYNDKVGRIFKSKLVSNPAIKLYEIVDYTCNNHEKVFLNLENAEFSTKEEYLKQEGTVVSIIENTHNKDLIRLLNNLK